MPVKYAMEKIIIAMVPLMKVSLNQKCIIMMEIMTDMVALT